jgi:hypothetical protein
MAITPFTPVSGGSPGQDFVGQIYMTSAIVSWTQAGGPGYYTVKSAGNQPGYVYFIGTSTVGAPLNGIAYVPSGFASLKIVGAQSDLCSLFKVSVKSVSQITSTPSVTTYASSQTGITLATNKTGFIDALLVGGGGYGGHHGGGGGAGGIVLLNSFPLSPTSPFDVVVGADTIFAGVRARGGGSHSNGSNANGTDGGCGSGGVSHNSSAYSGGLATQGSGTNAMASPLLFFSAYGTTATALGTGHGGGSVAGSQQHCGSGGGGAGGQGAPSTGSNTSTNPGAGGPGYLLPWNNTYYAAGGGGSNHNRQINGTGGTGWSSSGFGMGGNSQHNIGGNGTNGCVVVRSYDLP